MKVRIRVEFEVEPVDDHEGFDVKVARGAASQAAYDFLSLSDDTGYAGDTESVEVHVDGFGKCRVSIGEEHD